MKTALNLAGIVLLSISFTAVGQIQHHGTPLSLGFVIKHEIYTVKMPHVDIDELLREDEFESQMKDIPFRFGQPIHVDYGINNAGSWDSLPSGGRVWRLKIQSDGAITINLIFDKFFIPSGGSMFVYNEDKSMVLGAFTEENNLPERLFSTTPIKGDRIIIEYDQPSSLTTLPDIHVSVVVHGYKDIFSLLQKNIDVFGSSGSCNINVNCPSGASWRKQSRAVAMILLDDNSRWCTGSLINNTSDDGTPYFLTANHCWRSDQSTWIFMFKYESPDCSNTDGPTTYTISGSTLLARNPDSDFCLLLLSTPPPASWGPYYEGWNRQDVAATSGVGIHHPSGDIKKISFFNSSLVSDSYLNGNTTPANSHWRVNWSTGVTEPGSSGSPLFDQNNRVVGQLHGGYSACGGSDLRDWYGKFSMSWDRGTTSSTRLKDWLDPNNTGVLTLDGYESPLDVTLAASQFLEGGSGGTYEVNGVNVGSSWSGTAYYDQTIKANPPSGQIFYQWSDGSSANPRTIDATVNIYALYKAHLLTSLSTATGIGNQRKIVREYDGGPLDMGYSSSNKIWFTTSTDNGSTWSNEQQISGSGTASTPSIASDDWADVYIVWQEVVGSAKNLYIKSLYGGTTVLLDSDASSVDLQPVVAVSSDGDKILVVYKKMYSGRYQVHYKYSTDYGSTFSGSRIPPTGGPPLVYDYPSVAWDPQGGKFMLSANSTSGSLSVDLYILVGTRWADTANVYYSGSLPPSTPYSQIAVDGYGRTHVTWIAYDDYYTGGEFPSSAAMERNYYNGSLSAISIFRVQDVPIIYTSVSGHNDANGGASLFFCGNPTDYLRDIYSTDGSSWNGTINISPSGNRINYPISLEKAPPSSVTYTVVKGSSSPYNVISQTKDNSQPGYGYGTLKVASDANAQTATLYRRIELIDTTTGGLLTVQFGNISGNSSPFKNVNPGAIPAKAISDFMKTSPFTLPKDALMESEFGVRSKGWKRNANVSLELVDTVSGKTVQQIGSYNFAASDTGSFFQEKTNQIVNKLQNIKGILRVKIDSVDYENLVVNYMNVFVFGGSGAIKKQEKNIVQIGETPTEFQLTQNYPNPFNPTTQINYQLPANGYVTLKVYDVLGREIATLVDEEKSSGFYSVQWDAHNVSSGIYFYRIIAGNSNGQSSFTETKRMVVMK